MSVFRRQLHQNQHFYKMKVVMVLTALAVSSKAGPVAQVGDTALVVSNSRDGLFYSYFGLSGPDGLMVSEIIVFILSSLLVLIYWSHLDS